MPHHISLTSPPLSSISESDFSDLNLALDLDPDLLIPVLDEQVERLKPITQSSHTAPSKNPFLPYEHLEQLAKERELFRQELELLTHKIKSPNITSSDSKILPVWAEEIKKEVLKELQPVIERRVQALIDKRINQALTFNSNLPSK